MKQPGTRSQVIQDFLYSADGSITAGGTPQLVLPRAKSRSYLYFHNLSIDTMYLEFGGARATATLTSGAVTSFTVTNGGFGYVKRPKVWCLGGGPVEGNADENLGAGLPDWPSPGNVASGWATLTAGVVSSIAVQNPGAGYLRAPLVFIENHPADAYGVADPFYSSAASGFQILGGGSLVFEQQCPTDALAVYCATSALLYTCRYMY